MARIGVDVGGTNTDLVLETSGGVFYHKVPSTPADQSIGVIRGIREICDRNGVDPTTVEMIVHGTTVATNITIEHNGAEVGMITTKGFRDILHIGRHKRPHNFSLHFDVPWQSNPLVKRRNRIAVNERILPPEGNIETPLDEQAVRDATKIFKKRGLTAVIIGFMFSFLNDEHEQRAKKIILEEMPDAYVCCSSEVVNVLREYERFSTTAMNAYVGPKTSRYLNNLQDKLKSEKITAELRIMQSNGGISTVENCTKNAVSILMSGPAGGVIGGRVEGLLTGRENLITVDIGGTSADISTIPAGQLKIMNPRDTYVSGHPVMVPMIDLVTIGAGGGSIAYVDEAGGFNVGPRSAGADPGPACYGKGGEEPTVTDAQVVLGRLDADKLLGGELPIDPQKSFEVIEEKLAKPLGMSVTDAALGVIKIINSSMAMAIRSNSVAKGVDPREFTLMPFGGAGPLHGVALAEVISAKDVLIPVAPGITAAMGLLGTDTQYDFVGSLITNFNDVEQNTLDRINAMTADLQARCSEQMERDGIPASEQVYQLIAECRYHGQGFELRAEMPEAELTMDNVHIVVDNFHSQHKTDYGYAFEDANVELISVRVIAVAKAVPLNLKPIEKASGGEVEASLMYTRKTTFDDGQTLDTPRYDRGVLRVGNVVSGPSIIIQHNSTTLVPPDYIATVLEYGNLLITKTA